MNKPRLLDLFSGAGGCTAGYQRAGFWVRGVDIKPQPRYVGEEFVQSDALEYLAGLIESGEVEEFDVIHASPPCQAFTRAQNAAKNAAAHPNLITPTRELLQRSGGPYVIENVVGAPLLTPALLCGLAFGLLVKRHRLFESNLLLMTPPCPSHDQNYYVIFGHEVRSRVGVASDPKGTRCGRRNNIEVGRKAMGIDWMTGRELSQAIPPAYCEFIGRQLMAALERQ